MSVFGTQIILSPQVLSKVPEVHFSFLLFLPPSSPFLAFPIHFTGFLSDISSFQPTHFVSAFLKINLKCYQHFLSPTTFSLKTKTKPEIVNSPKLPF